MSLVAHNAVVTSAIFAPHPDLIVPQEPGAEKPDTECKSDVTDESEPIPSGNACNHGNLRGAAFVFMSDVKHTIFLFPYRSFKNGSHGSSPLRRLHRRHQSVRQREKILSALNLLDLGLGGVELCQKTKQKKPKMILRVSLYCIVFNRRTINPAHSSFFVWRSASGECSERGKRGRRQAPPSAQGTGTQEVDMVEDNRGRKRRNVSRTRRTSFIFHHSFSFGRQRSFYKRGRFEEKLNCSRGRGVGGMKSNCNVASLVYRSSSHRVYTFFCLYSCLFDVNDRAGTADHTLCLATPTQLHKRQSLQS